MRAKLIVVVAAVLALTACDKPVAKPTVTPTPSASVSPSATQTRDTSRLPKITMTGGGNYQVGAPQAALESSLQQKETSCAQLTVAKGVGEYADLLVAFSANKLVYVMVDTPTIATEDGITVGSSLTEVRAAYPQGQMLPTAGSPAMSVHGAAGAGLLIRFNETESTVATIQAGTATDLEARFAAGSSC